MYAFWAIGHRLSIAYILDTFSTTRHKNEAAYKDRRHADRTAQDL